MDPIEAEILRQTDAVGAGKSICPSDVAQTLGADWQRWLKPVRAAALRLARQGRIEVLRKGKPVADLDAVKGVIRLRAAPTVE